MGLANRRVPASSGQDCLAASTLRVGATGASSSPAGLGTMHLCLYLRWLVGDILLLLSLSSSAFQQAKVKNLGSNRFSLSDVAVDAFLPNKPWKVRGGKWLLWRFWLSIWTGMESVTHYQILNRAALSLSCFCFSGNVCFYSVSGQFTYLIYLILRGNYIMNTWCEGTI